MTAKSSLLLLLSLATVALPASVPTEPNTTSVELRFEMDREIMPWVIETDVNGKSITYHDPGAIRPTYMAKVILPRNEMFSSAGVLAKTMDSPLAQKLSEAQKEFLAQGFGVWVDTSAANVPDHYSANFYAVSEEDAKIMARALPGWL
jgi:hypothetical protein